MSFIAYSWLLQGRTPNLLHCGRSQSGRAALHTTPGTHSPSQHHSVYIAAGLLRVFDLENNASAAPNVKVVEEVSVNLNRVHLFKKNRTLGPRYGFARYILFHFLDQC